MKFNTRQTTPGTGVTARGTASVTARVAARVRVEHNRISHCTSRPFILHTSTFILLPLLPTPYSEGITNVTP